MKTAAPKGRRILERPVTKALGFGLVSLFLYVSLFVWEEQILGWTTKGGWYFIIPVVAAFIFSFFHGGFTGYFWEVLGIWEKPGTNKK